ncbi:unnamed protein product [Clonostachys rhizophaga]|uniref:Heterokaryon incompatibility domain-containing protein n=1 Tax=Clonostachys rhizophaga TaxID=160324 RepID=A0A9N9YRU9_9HYPO|nr:unnamed protein product [Clonostachys rhizophaga]
MLQTKDMEQFSSIDHDCTPTADSCKGWDDLTHVMECLEPEYPHIDPERFNYGFGAEDDISIDKPKGAVDSDQDLGSLNYRPLDQYSSSMTCILCLRIEEAIRVSISPISRIEVGLWRPFRVLSGTFLCEHREAITAEDLRMEKNGDKQSVRLILPVCVKSQASGTAGMLFKTLLVGLEFHYAHSRYELEGITTWDCSRLDPGIVKQFVENCREHHGSDCNELLWAAKIPRFLRVIDTKNWCVQPAPEEPFEYLALSYVWGAPTEAQSQKDIKVLRLDTTTLAELEQKGSLRKYSIPEVILDAITLCADLGYQYLWVDRLCIIQDEGNHKHSQINAMDSIYHMATLTIVSLGGCSSEGLPGVSSRPRDTLLMSNLSDGAFSLMENTRMLLRPQYTIRSLLRSGINEAGPIKRKSCPGGTYMWTKMTFTSTVSTRYLNRIPDGCATITYTQIRIGLITWATATTQGLEKSLEYLTLLEQL